MIDPRIGIIVIAALAWFVQRKRILAWPVAWCLTGLAAIDAARGFAIPARVNSALWCLWPCVSAWFSWRVWRGEGERSIGAASLVYAIVLGFAPLSWAEHPSAYAWVIRAPYMVSPVVSLIAWSQGARGGWGRRIAAVLAWSGFVDLFAGALAFDSWNLAAPLSWATWIAIGGMLVRWWTSG